jgi:hypothetical protein
MIFIVHMFCRYECAYGPDDHCNDPNHVRSIKWGCLASFFIKQLYTWPKVMELCFYHQTHTRMDQKLTHDHWNLESLAYISQYGGCILQWTTMEVTVAIFLRFDECSCIQFLIHVEYNKKGFTYVKLTHEVHKHRKKHIKSMNAQLVMDFAILATKNVTNYRYWLLSHNVFIQRMWNFGI